MRLAPFGCCLAICGCFCALRRGTDVLLWRERYDELNRALGAADMLTTCADDLAGLAEPPSIWEQNSRHQAGPSGLYLRTASALADMGVGRCASR